MRFRRALDRRNVTEALSAATEIQVVGLVEALELTLLLADRDPAKYERAALRWHARFMREVPKVEMRESQAILPSWLSSRATRRLRVSEISFSHSIVQSTPTMRSMQSG
jgi:hypothetical protein